MHTIALEDKPLLWLRQFRLASQKSIDAWAGHFCLSGVQAIALDALLSHDGMEQRELHEYLEVTSPTLTGVVDGLVRARFVARKLHPDDARVKQLYLTDEGRTLAARIHEEIALYQRYLFDDFTPEELAQLRSLLSRITLKLEAAPAFR